jgi:hypothetical protein
MQAETPTMLAMNYASRAYAGDGSAWQGVGAAGNLDLRRFSAGKPVDLNNLNKLLEQAANQEQAKGLAPMANQNQRRLVQVFIADPNDNIPVDQCLLYSGEQKLTDLTDQELFFEIDIKSLLAAHNEKRVKIVDKTVKERTEYLEAARVRDLKMVVATLATF